MGENSFENWGDFQYKNDHLQKGTRLCPPPKNQNKITKKISLNFFNTTEQKKN